tara:strand:+ start:640 stop:897 length:258 start_codon:yes stop_codon:yes gene_type:complete
MSNTTKSFTEYDQAQIFQKAYNKEEGTIAVGSFVAGKVGHKIIRAVQSSTVDDFSYYDGATLLYTLRVTYNNGSHDEVDMVERTV